MLFWCFPSKLHDVYFENALNRQETRITSKTWYKSEMQGKRNLYFGNKRPGVYKRIYGIKEIEYIFFKILRD